jgi:hypothetical protein
MQTIEAGPINHLVEIYTVRSFFERSLGIDPDQEVQLLDWLTFPEQASWKSQPVRYILMG